MNQAIVEDLVTASHILADQGVLDGPRFWQRIWSEKLYSRVFTERFRRSSTPGCSFKR